MKSFQHLGTVISIRGLQINGVVNCSRMNKETCQDERWFTKSTVSSLTELGIFFLVEFPNTKISA